MSSGLRVYTTSVYCVWFASLRPMKRVPVHLSVHWQGPQFFPSSSLDAYSCLPHCAVTQYQHSPLEIHPPERCCLQNCRDELLWQLQTESVLSQLAAHSDLIFWGKFFRFYFLEQLCFMKSEYFPWSTFSLGKCCLEWNHGYEQWQHRHCLYRF